MVANWGVKFDCGDGGSVPIEASLECGLGFTDILDHANSARYQIYNIKGGASDIALGTMRLVGGGANESITFVDVYITNDTSVSCTFEGAMPNGRGMISKGRDFSTNDEISEIAGASESNDGSVGDSL